MYREMLELLEALPNKRLLSRTTWDPLEESGCFFGSIAPGFDRTTYCVQDFVRILERSYVGREHHCPLTQKWLKGLGLSNALIWEIQRLNDGFAGTPEERYDYMLRWLRQEVETHE